MPKFLSIRPVLLAALTLTAACTIKDATPPPLTGPSEFALSLTMMALPDLITRDGVSSSTIVVTARHPDGSPAANVQLRFDMQIETGPGVFVLVDFGSLSPKTAFTASDGRASIVYTPPAYLPGGSPVISRVRIIVTPVLTNQQTHNFNFQTVEIRLVTPNTNTPGAPVAFFTYAPANPAPLTEVVFNASGSYPVTASSITNYAWDWGDGTNDLFNPGPNEDHDWAAAGTYYVTLTVTDNVGQKGSTTQAITVQ